VVINRYRGQARVAAELRLKQVMALDEGFKASRGYRPGRPKAKVGKLGIEDLTGVPGRN
jgi:hypothetical protein